jgi:hypothetical protein
VTHAALTDPTLFYFLVGMTLLLVMFLGAVIAAPPASPDSPAPQVLEVHALPVVQAPAAPGPLPRRAPPATAPTAGAGGWSAEADAASQDGAPMPVYDSVRRPEVSGSPPWGPAPKPPGPDPWATGNFSPGWRPWPDEESMSPGAGQTTSSEPPPGMPAPAGNQTRYPRHARGRLSMAAESAQ